MKKADYRRIASSYDRGRPLSEQSLTLWLTLISQLSGASRGTPVLDLGCGTGRFALPFADRLGYRVTGADCSIEMLEMARQKDRAGLVKWVVSDAASLAFPPASFELVFMSHVLHHVESPLAVLRECCRILRPSGVVLVRYGAIEQIRGDVIHTLFPEVQEIDETRTPSVRRAEEWLASAGFVEISSREVVQQTYSNAQARLDAVRNRSTSVLTMISDRSYQEGLCRLEQYVSEHPDDDWLLFDRMTITLGRKTLSHDAAQDIR